MTSREDSENLPWIPRLEFDWKPVPPKFVETLPVSPKSEQRSHLFVNPSPQMQVKVSVDLYNPPLTCNCGVLPDVTKQRGRGWYVRLDLSASIRFTWMADCCSMKGSVVMTTILSPSDKSTALAGDSKLKEWSWTPVSVSQSFTDWSAELVTKRDVSPAHRDHKHPESNVWTRQRSLLWLTNLDWLHLKTRSIPLIS